MIDTWPGWENAGLIGEGSFGRVYRIQREEFGRVYEAALKVITIPGSQADVRAAYEEGMDEESVTEYFRGFVEEVVAEFALLSELKGNSNIVSYEDHMVVQRENEVGWDILIRMELLTALTDYASAHPLEEADVIRLGLDMTRALELCRRRGIVHRDIKPENIFISRDGNFKLGDFGVARVAEKTVSAMSRKGTYNYMAPEVYRGEEYGFAADLYSLGLVLYRFLNDNRTPFLPPYPEKILYRDKEEALNKRMSGTVLPPPAHGSGALKKVVAKACAYHPGDRYESASKFGNALRALCGGAKEADPAVWEEEPEDRRPEPDGRKAEPDSEKIESDGGRAESGSRKKRLGGRKTEPDDRGEESGGRKTKSHGKRAESGNPFGKGKTWYQKGIVGALILPAVILIQCFFFTDHFLDSSVYSFYDSLHSSNHYYILDAKYTEHMWHCFLLYLCFFGAMAGMAQLWKKVWLGRKRAAFAAGFALAAVLAFLIRGTLWVMVVTETEPIGILLAEAVMCGIWLLRRKIPGKEGKRVSAGWVVSVHLFLYGGAILLYLPAACTEAGWAYGYSGWKAMARGFSVFFGGNVMNFLFIFSLFILLPIGAGVGTRIFCARRKRKG